MARSKCNRSQEYVDEQTPLLQRQNSDEDEQWTRPKGFWWIETAIWANVFLCGFDSTFTASTYTLISSEFNAANTASWLTTSYLVTSTAFQPLYGRFSDVFGRRACFFVSTLTFMMGCLGCAIALDMFTLNVMRGLTGVGGGGLITMATIINSDLIPFRRRGNYQALQNVLVGFGSICGASLGGAMALSIGWRWCFLIQVPISLLGFTVGYSVLENPEAQKEAMVELKRRNGGRVSVRKILGSIDLSGSALLVCALLAQLLGLSLGGNEIPWCSRLVVNSLIGSGMLLALFVLNEALTPAIPVVPLRLLKGRLPVATQITNVFAGAAAYASLFMLPLFFQVVLGDNPAQAGARLIIPSLATPIGGLIMGYSLSHGGRLADLVRVGTALMAIGNFLLATLQFKDARWKYFVYLVPANLGLGMANPSILFSFISAFEHKEQAVATSLVYLIRSLGTIYGVTATSAIVQNVLLSRLPAALKDMPHKDKMIDEIRHSVFAIRGLPPAARLPARLVYYDAIRIAFLASAAFAGVSAAFAWVSCAKGLQRGEDAGKAVESGSPNVVRVEGTEREGEEV